MDIVVTIPKTKLELIEREERYAQERREAGEDIHFFWSMRRKPVNLNVGDKCYFVWDGAMRCCHEVIAFGEDMRCEFTGFTYPGFSLVLDPIIHEIDPVPMESFRGFRYRRMNDATKH